MKLNLNNQFTRKIFCAVSIALILVGCESREAKFEAKVRSVITDPQKLQDWAVPIIKEHEVYYDVPYTNWPDFLRATNGPNNITIMGWTSVKGNAIFVVWGGSFGTRGVIVGDKNFVMTDEDMGRPVIQWVPGVYIVPKTE